MTAIDRLLRKAGELNSAGMKELSPGLAEMAAVQADVAEALGPFLEAMASVAGAQPFRYGFVLPSEPPGFKADSAEPAQSQSRAEVSLGPVNVYTVAAEIQKALDHVGRDSTNLQGIYSTYAPRQAALPDSQRGPEYPKPAAATGSQLRASSQPPRPVFEPGAAEAERNKARAQESSRAKTEEWVGESIRRSGVVLKDLQEVQENIITSTITTENVRELSQEALSIGSAAAMSSASLRLPDKPAAEEVQERPVFPSGSPGGTHARSVEPGRSREPENRQLRVFTPEPTTPATSVRVPLPATTSSRTPGDSRRSPAAPAQETGEHVLPGVVKAPTIRLRSPSIIPPHAGDADFNARSLSRARTLEAESGRQLPEPAQAPREKTEKPAKVEWPLVTSGSSDRPPMPDAPQRRRDASKPGWNGPARASAEPGAGPAAGSPVVQVIRSFGAMGDALRSVTEIGAAATFAWPAATVPPVPGAGASLLNAMAGMAPVAMPDSPDIGRLPAATSVGYSPGQAAQPAASSAVPSGSSGSQVVILAPGSGAPAARPVLGLTASVSAARASQLSGVAAIQRLIQAAPQVAGSIVSQSPVIYEAGRGLPFSVPVTPAAASGAESIVNISVPPAAHSKGNESSTTNKVANFHNTFNITVNLQSAEERDLKDLGKKIGQLLSEELKRYGGLS